MSNLDSILKDMQAENEAYGTDWSLTGLADQIARFSDGRCFDRYYNLRTMDSWCA
jgi:hypothetical protein